MQNPDLIEAGSVAESSSKSGLQAEARGKSGARSQPLIEKIKKSCKNENWIDFESLYLTESKQLGKPVASSSIRKKKGTAGEPFLSFTAADRLGVALSGGGIRSATFNLGLLQALGTLGILKEVDYLSTVSGGGYVGGFWAAWVRRAEENADGACFPVPDTQDGERAEVRHLREFSRFLLPRMGVTQTEFWTIAMVILGGLLPSLITALAVLFLLWSGWLALSSPLLLGRPAGSIALGVGLVLFFYLSEKRWKSSNPAEPNPRVVQGYLVGSIVALVFLIGASWLRHDPAIAAYLSTHGLRQPDNVFYPALLLGFSTALLLTCRIIMARFCRTKSSIAVADGFERAVTRTLAATVVFAFLAALWSLSGAVEAAIAVKVSGTGAVTSALAFSWAKKWLLEPAEKNRGATFLQSMLKSAKRATPKILATLTWLLLFCLVAAVLHGMNLDPVSLDGKLLGGIIAVGATILCLTVVFFDPSRIGMHEFYRARISRCYLGASNLDPEIKSELERVTGNRYVIERLHDDLLLKDFENSKGPIHLVCTAANDISGDHLATLYRGAQSAVLSRNGISIGNKTAPLDDLRLSSALTASAAAFNSQMGRVSIDLGPAVTFLMSALNLRLGLWVPHPDNSFRGNYLLPGRFFLYELFGRSRVDKRHLHLSDGGHFENLALYELIRRHTRYVIVSDCGADPDVAFDDLANALRLIREDFGVEIELDVAPLRRNETGFASQHAVVGTIHYDGLAGLDKGTILYFKPALTGDEPPDVLQYRTRNPRFPHESTGDQFYDEAQWESYRRLGEHAGRAVLGFYEQPEAKLTHPMDRLFKDARARWHPAPSRQQQDFLEMTARCAALEQDISSTGLSHLRREFFSEVAELAGSPPAALSADEELQTFIILMRVLQIMEDVWLAADLDKYWSHPLNEGWMTYFHRWAATPFFRRAWPLLSPIYSAGFREFAKSRFSVGIRDDQARPGREKPYATAELSLRKVEDVNELRSTRIRQGFEQLCGTLPESGVMLFVYELKLLSLEGGVQDKSVPVGFIRIEETDHELIAHWKATHMYVPPFLQGSGIQARFLDAVIARFKNEKNGERRKQYDALRVEFVSPGRGHAAGAKVATLGKADRHEIVREIEFYKSRGFVYAEPEEDNCRINLVLRLPPKDGGNRFA